MNYRIAVTFKPNIMNTSSASQKSISVWDLPTRLFHWLLVALFVFSWVSAEIGGNAMEYHMLSGYAVLTLVLFRLLWGIAGSSTARFSHFVTGWKGVKTYLHQIKASSVAGIGHNPLGGWAVIAMLVLLLVQAGTGLFANDDIATEGPLYHLISKDWSDALTELHEGAFNVLLGLVGLHIAAIAFYLLAKRNNLVRPMIFGHKQVPPETKAPTMASAWLALPLLLIAAAIVYYLVTKL